MKLVVPCCSKDCYREQAHSYIGFAPPIIVGVSLLAMRPSRFHKNHAYHPFIELHQQT